MDNLEQVKKLAEKNKKSSKTLLATPSNIRVASSYIERFRRLLITLVYALFVGLAIYHVQAFGMKNGASLTDSSALFYKAVAFVFSILMVCVSAYYIHYSAKIQNKTTWMRTFRHLFNGLLPLIAVLLLALGVIGNPTDKDLATGDSSAVASGTNIFIYMVAVGVFGSATWTFIENFVQRKKFPGAFRVARNLFPGVVVMLVGFVLISTKTSGNDTEWTSIVMPALIGVAGAVLVFLAAAMTTRTSDYGNKLKKLIKYGYVTHLMTTFTILTCFLFSQANFGLLSKFSFSLIVFAVQVVATLIMITFIVYSSRNKKNLQTNPIHNRIMLMTYIGFVNVLGLLAIFVAPHTLTEVGDKSQFAFTFLGLSALLTVLVLLVAGAFAFMTIEFKGFAAIVMAALQLIFILFLSLVIFAEKDVAVITHLMGRFVVLLIYASTLVIYLLFEAYWVLYLFLGEKSDRKELKRAQEAQRAQELREGQNG